MKVPGKMYNPNTDRMVSTKYYLGQSILKIIENNIIEKKQKKDYKHYQEIGHAIIPVLYKDKIYYSKVDVSDYWTLLKYKFYLTPDGYAKSQDFVLHRFLLKASKDSQKVDHINGNKLDNRRVNLKFSSDSQNSQNKPKKTGCSSKYIGVSRQDNKWRCAIRTSENNVYNRHIFFFDLEEHAAYYYDFLALQYHGPTAQINKVQKPANFKEPTNNKKMVYGKKATQTKHGTYRIKIQWANKTIHLGTFKTEKEAQEAYNKKKEELIKEHEHKIKNTEIKRNSVNQAIISLANDKGYFIVDDDKYHDLIRYKWYLSDNYVKGTIGNKHVQVHVYLMAPKKGEIVDHINKNPRDNRLCNLRISNNVNNTHNKTKKSNCSSNFYGVSFRKECNKFKAYIVKDGKNYYIGLFITELDAALAYNTKAKELYKSGANLNDLTLDIMSDQKLIR